MKKKEILIIALLLVVCIEAFSVAFKFVVKAAVHRGNESFHIVSDKKIVENTVELSEFKKLDLDVASVNTYVEPGDTYKLEYHVYENNIPVIDQGRDSLSIKQPSNVGLFNFNPGNWEGEEQYYKITVPKTAEVINVDMEATSGMISIEDIDVEGKILISSGNVKLENSKSDELYLHATSGNIEMKDVELQKLKLDLTSGDLCASDCVAENIDAEMTSGNMDFDDMKFNNAYFDLTSGNIELEAVGSEDDYSFDMKSTSGDFEVNGKKIDEGYHTDAGKDRIIKVDMTSGSFNISFTE